MAESAILSETPVVEFRGIHKGYVNRDGRTVPALEAVSFTVPADKITCIVGPTGSGKTTLLRIAAGLETPDSGTLELHNHDVPAGKGMGYISQSHTLFPWMRVRDNIGLPLKIRGQNQAKIEKRVQEISLLLGLQDALDLFVHELSGGMQQRTSLGRLLAMEARLWLMDEPFSALDDRTRHQLQRLLARLVKEQGLSVLFVTHAIDEAVYLADRVVILSAGPGRVIDIIDPVMVRPRDRMSGEFGKSMELIRQKIESVLSDTEDPEAF